MTDFLVHEQFCEAFDFWSLCALPEMVCQQKTTTLLASEFSKLSTLNFSKTPIWLEGEDALSVIVNCYKFIILT